MADYRAAIAAYIRDQARPPDKYSHQPRLYQLALQVGTELAYDDDILYAAAWLHDLGVFIGHRPEESVALSSWDNVAYAMSRAPELLRGFGFPEEKISAVIEAIHDHLPSRHPTSIEASILHDADILEQLGAVGILRTVSKVGRDTRFHSFTDALAALQHSLESLPNSLNIPMARQLAEPRIRLLQAFLAGAMAEAAGAPL